MKKNGFTLVELLAVIVLMALIMLLIFPSIRNIYTNNQTKQYESYEDMMVEYVKTISNYKNETYICLSSLGMEKINDNSECRGYVKISEMKGYLICETDDEVIYKTAGYDTSNSCY